MYDLLGRRPIDTIFMDISLANKVASYLRESLLHVCGWHQMLNRRNVVEERR